MPETRPKPYCRIVDGVPRCPFTKAEWMRKAVEFIPQNGDLLQVSYPKSGTHWLQFITQLILREGAPITTYVDFLNAVSFLEYCDISRKSPSQNRHGQAFMTHLPLRKDKMNIHAKYVYVARNPWDVCVSLYHHIKSLSVHHFQDGTFQDFLDAFLDGKIGYGDYFEHLLAGYSLRDAPNVFFVTYEELKRDTRGVVLRLARFLGKRYGRMLQDGEQGQKKLSLILQRSSSENMRDVVVQDFSQDPDPEVDAWYKELNILSTIAHGGDTKRHTYVREAKVGGWEEHFSPEQLRRMEAAIAHKLQGSDVLQLWPDIRRHVLLRASEESN